MQWKDQTGAEMEDKVENDVPLLGNPGADGQN